MDYKLESNTPPDSSDWNIIRALLPNRKNFMEIGVYEGRSVIWTVETLLDDGGTILCIDPWQEEGFDKIESAFDHNLEILRKRNPSKQIIKEKSPALPILCEAILESRKYDFIYIDALKKYKESILCSCLAWNLLENGGILMWDDYTSNIMDSKLAINAFILFHKEELHVLHRGKRCIVQKVKK